MTLLYIGLAVLAAFLLIWWGARSRGSGRGEGRPGDNLDTVAAWPPRATRVLTSAEQRVFDLLRLALPAHMILAQVPLQRFLKVPTRNSYSEWLRRAGQINVDLVVCDRYSQVIAVVEVQSGDDAQGARAERRRRRMMRVLEAADIPLHLWSAETLPSIEAVRQAIAVDVTAEEAMSARPSVAHEGLAAAFETTMRPGTDEKQGELREPPPSTWFDDLETGPAPLSVSSAAPSAPVERHPKGRPAH